jgi:PAS domain S-box-containing protein
MIFANFFLVYDLLILLGKAETNPKPMSIHSKIGILLFFAVVGIAAAGIYAQHQIALPGYLDLEREEAIKDIQRLVAAIDNQIEHLSSICLDWASWDDTYAFIESRDADYIATNLLIDTFENNRLNLIYFYDLQHQVVWGEIRDIHTGAALNVRQFPSNALPKTHPVSADQHAGQKIRKGMLTTDHGPMLVAACPILKSDHEGPSRGMLIMGRFIDEELLQVLSGLTLVDYRIEVINDDTPLPPSTKDIIARIDDATPYVIVPVDSKQLMAYSILPDISGNPGLLLSLSLKREISSRGNETIRIGIYLIILASIIFFVLVLVSLNRLVISPMKRLTAHALNVRRNGDYSVRLRINRSDEIGILSREFDALLADIEQSTRKLTQANQNLEADMTLRMKALSALQESEERFRAMLDQAIDAMYLLDMEGKFRMVNRVACEGLGYHRSELLQMSVPDIDPDSEKRGDKENIWVRLEEKPALLETRHQRKDGSFFPVEVSLSAFQYQDETLLLAIARDITDRKQLENRLRYTQKREAIRTLTAGIAHNFNNILAVIMGNTELAEQSLPVEHPARTRLKHIEVAVTRARDIVWQLIHFSHQAMEESKPVDIQNAVAETMKIKKSSLPANIVVQTIIEDNRHLIQITPEQIRLIISNLWDNAVDAMTDHGGRLEVRVENIVLESPLSDMDREMKPGNYLRISMTDTGRGIDPAHLDSIFDPYFTTKDFAYGAGMGLAIVQGIVQGNGGSITVNSTPGQGTRVCVFFPAA